MKHNVNFIYDYVGSLEEEYEKLKRNIPGFTANIEDISICPVVLCDNEVDIDNEVFPSTTLEKLSKLFIGKSGIFENGNTMGRIYDCKVITSPNVEFTETDERYMCLVGMIYILKSTETNNLIKEIESGIKKEVSISCSISRKICSICNKAVIGDSCSYGHIKGNLYPSDNPIYRGHNKADKCFHYLLDPNDAYEWSFVIPAVPVKSTLNSSSDFIVKKTNEDMTLEERVQLLEDTISSLFYEFDMTKNKLNAFKRAVSKVIRLSDDNGNSL